MRHCLQAFSYSWSPYDRIFLPSQIFLVLSKKNMRLIFCGFWFSFSWLAISVKNNSDFLFREIHTVSGTTRPSLDRSIVQGETQGNKKTDTCRLMAKQTKRKYLIDGWIKWQFRTKKIKIVSYLLVTWTLKIVSYDTFCHETYVVYSDCNISANILFTKVT